jgi:hypothetical protein
VIEVTNSTKSMETEQKEEKPREYRSLREFDSTYFPQSVSEDQLTEDDAYQAGLAMAAATLKYAQS